MTATPAPQFETLSRSEFDGDKQHVLTKTHPICSPPAYPQGPVLEGAMEFTTLLVWFGLGIGVFGWATAARGEDQRKCYRRIQDDRRDLARAVEQHGYYSSQARHERNELQRDEAKCGYFDRNDEAEDRWRGNGGPSDDSRYDDDGRRGHGSPAFDIGYRDGLAIGRRDRERGKAFRPDKNDYYEDADHGYEKFYGDKGLYRLQYREAFQRGYAGGFDYRR